MFNTESLQEKWSPILEHSELDPIKDNYRKAVTSVLLENQERFLAEERGLITEAAPPTLLVVLVTVVALQLLVLLQVSTLC